MDHTFYIKVIPGAKQNRFRCDDGQIKIYLQAPAVDGKANDALISFISKCLCLLKSDSGKIDLVLERYADLFHNDTTCKIKKSQISIIKGLKSRAKTISIVA